MTTYETRTQRMQNEAALLRQDEAGQRVLRHVARMGFALGLLIAIRYYHGSDNVVIFAAALFVALWGWGIVGLYIDLTTWMRPVESDEFVSSVYNEAQPGAARLMVRTTPRTTTVGDLNLKNYERLALGHTFARDGWKWRRDPIFRKAGITNYAARYAALTEAVQEAGMIDAHGMIREGYRAWWTSPTPQIVDHYSIDGADDDPSSGRIQ